MPCKIADDPQSVQRLSWPSSGGPAAGLRLAASPVFREENERSAEANAEREQTHQAELASCRQQAFEEGLRKGRQEWAQEAQSMNERLAQALKDLIVSKRRLRNEAESDVVKLSLAVARRILHRELQTDPDSIQGVVYAGLQKLQNREISQIRVAPQGLAAVQGALERAGVGSGVSIVPDARMRLGDVVIETAFGELDASVETQLGEIERGFVDRLGIAC